MERRNGRMAGVPLISSGTLKVTLVAGELERAPPMEGKEVVGFGSGSFSGEKEVGEKLVLLVATARLRAKSTRSAAPMSSSPNL
jgi:hypothetical protein